MNNPINQRFIEIVEALKISNKELAEICGWHEHTYYNMKSTGRTPNANYIQKLKDRSPLINTNYLFHGVGSPFISIASTVNSRIKDVAKSKVLSPVSFSEIVGISERDAIEILENGLQPSPDTIEKIAVGLNINKNWILTGKGSIEPEQPVYTSLSSENQQSNTITLQKADYELLLKENAQLRLLCWQANIDFSVLKNV